jgi:hypothetical protein
MAADSEEVAAYVSAHVQGAAQAVRERDIEGVVRCLDAAVALYEQNPSCIQKPTSQLRDLLVFIRSARSLSQTLKREDDDLRELEKGRRHCGSRRFTERRSK